MSKTHWEHMRDYLALIITLRELKLHVWTAEDGKLEKRYCLWIGMMKTYYRLYLWHKRRAER